MQSDTAALKFVIWHPDSEGGVADMMQRLAGAMTAAHPLMAVRIEKLTRSTALAQTNDAESVHLLNLSHYGYQKRGVPLWLLTWAKSLKAAGGVLGVYFHELFATGPPWRSSFWLGPVQRHITRSLLNLSDFWITNRVDSAKLLSRWSDSPAPHLVAPVFSNVGELMRVSSEQRREGLVIFGSSQLRRQVISSIGTEFIEIAVSRGQPVHDIGPPMKELSERLAKRGVHVHGKLPNEEVSRILAGARYGLLDYPAAFLGKSGVFAAYAAHGVCPILTTDASWSNDGLRESTHFVKWHPDFEFGSDANWKVGENAWAWYDDHTVAIQARRICSLVTSARVGQ